MSSAFEGLPKTPNLKLNKPGYDNVADIEALNENSDILDAEIQGIKNTFVKSVNGINAGDDGNVDLGIIPIAKGGTGANNAENARKNLGIKDVATYDVLPISQGGTGATTASQARVNLGLATVASTGSYNDLSNKPSIPYSASATAIGGASASKPAVVVETYKKGTSWYRKYSDGWIEQGGVYDSGSIQAGISATITFLKAFTVNPLTVSLSVMRGDNNNLANVPNIGSFSKTSMYLYAGRFTSTGGTRYFSWYACGY